MFIRLIFDGNRCKKELKLSENQFDFIINKFITELSDVTYLDTPVHRNNLMYTFVLSQRFSMERVDSTITKLQHSLKLNKSLEEGKLLVLSLKVEVVDGEYNTSTWYKIELMKKEQDSKIIIKLIPAIE